MQPAELDVPGGDVERGPGVPAAWAAVVAEMADVGGCEVVRRSAAKAVLRVSRVLEVRPGVTRVVQAEAERGRATVGKIRDDGIVGVHDQRRVDGKALGGGAPALGDELQLAVAVELVAEEVAEGEDARLQPRERLGQRGLVHLEQPELGSPRRDEGRRDPGEQVRTGPVPREASPIAEDLRRHRGRRGLAVRRREDNGALGQASRERVHRSGVELPQHLSGDGRAAPATDGTRQRAEPARGGGLEAEAQAHRAASVPVVREARLLWDVCRIRRAL